MKGNTPIRLSVAIRIVAIACDASGALSVDEQVKMLAERYRQVEDQLARSIRYTSKDESGGATIVRQEWYNSAESKLAAEQLQLGVDEGLGCGEADLVLAFSRILVARCRSGSAFALSPITS
jgi:hypothetical protein